MPGQKNYTFVTVTDYDKTSRPILLFKIGIHLVAKTWQQLLQQFLDTVSFFSLLRPAGWVGEVKAISSTLLQHNLQLHPILRVWRNLLNCNTTSTNNPNPS